MTSLQHATVQFIVGRLEPRARSPTATVKAKELPMAVLTAEGHRGTCPNRSQGLKLMTCRPTRGQFHGHQHIHLGGQTMGRLIRRRCALTSWFRARLTTNIMIWLWVIANHPKQYMTPHLDQCGATTPAPPWLTIAGDAQHLRQNRPGTQRAGSVASCPDHREINRFWERFASYISSNHLLKIG